MKTITYNQIESAVESLVTACSEITPSCVAAMEGALERETDPNAKTAIGMLLENAALAKAKGLAVCQDTGMAVFFVRLGQDVHIELVLGDKLEITFLPKGFGSENMSRLFMLKPSQGVEGIKDCVVQAVKEAGANPCPPVIVGVGIGGTAEKAMSVAKEQLLREVGKPSDDETLAGMEKELLERINALSIGAQGFGGKTTALAVHIGKYPTHIAALPVAINVQCNAMRKSSAVL